MLLLQFRRKRVKMSDERTSRSIRLVTEALDVPLPCWSSLLLRWHLQHFLYAVSSANIVCCTDWHTR